MLKMVDGTGIIGLDMVCPLGGAVSPPQPPNFDKVEMEGVGSLMLPNSLKAPLERVELIGNSTQGENPAPDNPQEIKSAGKHDGVSGKYLFDVKVTGKNLLNLQKEPDVKGTYQGWKVGDGKKTIVLSIKDKGNNVDITKCSIGVSGNGINPNDGLGWIVQDGTILRSEIKTTNPYVTIYPPNETAVQKFLDRFEIQVEYGTTATPYEPYAEQFMQIVLNEPLRGIGEYKDMLTKDGVVRKIYPPYEINLNDLRDGGYSRTNTVMFSVKVQNKTVGYASSKPSILCNILPDCALQMSNIYNNDKECIAVGGGIVLFRVNKSRLKDISSFEATKQSFIELMADKKMIVEYALETPVTEPLPESVQQQLQALHSENGTTHVFVDSGEVPCGIKLTYRKEK